MRVACYYPWVYLRSGAERTILEVARRSGHEWTVYTNHFSRDGTYAGFADVRLCELPLIPVKRSFFRAAQAGLTILLQRLPVDEYDVLVVHSEGLGDLITFRNHSKPVICYCHTPLKVIHDSNAKRAYIERNPGKAHFLSLFGAIFTLMDRLAWRNYSHIFANSETVRQRILRAGLAGGDRVEVLPPGVDCETIKPTDHFGKFFLLLSRLKWWKNVELAIEGFKAFRNSSPEAEHFRLIVAGQVDEGSRGYFRELQNLAKSCEAIEFIPDPSCEKVEELYGTCYAVLNTTLNEDWGIVPVEANAHGKPVIAVNRGGPTESQLNGVTGLLAEPTPPAFAAAMARLAGDESLARAMGKAGRVIAQHYDWKIHVARLDAFLDSIARGRYGNVAGGPDLVCSEHGSSSGT